MVATKHDAEKAGEILQSLEQDEQAPWLRFESPRSFEDELHPWVKVALTQLVLLIGSDEVMYAQAVRDEGTSAGRIIVFTAGLLAISEVKDVADGTSRPRSTAAARHRLRSLRVEGGAGIILDPDDTSNRHAVAVWPQKVQVTVEYEGLPSPVTISGAGANRWDRETPSPILGLLSALRDDLTSSART